MITKEKLKNAWEVVKSYLLSYLQQNVAKIAIAKLIKAGLKITTFKEWLISLIVDYLYDDIGEPILKLLLNRAEYAVEYIDGKLIVSRIKKAKNENDQTSYDHAMDDLLN